MRTIVMALLLGVLIALGCGYEPAAPKPAPPGAKTETAAAKPAPKPAALPAAAPAQPGQSGMTANMTAAAGAAGMAPLDLMDGSSGARPAGQSRPAPPPSANLEKAQPGVGKQGRDYGGGAIMAPVTVPVRTLFQARDRITFDIQIAEAMKLYKATNGAAPKTHEEFMEKIIKENQIKLPELPAGKRYVYDPKQEDLMVGNVP